MGQILGEQVRGVLITFDLEHPNSFLEDFTLQPEVSGLHVPHLSQSSS